MNIPQFPSFDVDADKSNAAHRWHKWVGRLENLLTGLNITNDARKRALLLHYAGERVYDIYDAEKGETEETYDDTKQVITNYFAPKVNTKMEVYKFRTCKQKDEQTLDEYVTELRTLSKNCEFNDVDSEILQQVIQNCKSNRLRRRALQEPDKKLTDILLMGRAIEVANEQASEMEKTTETVKALNSRQKSYNRSANPQQPIASKRDYKKKHTTQCRNCGGNFPHRGPCPAKGKTCNFCKKQNHFMKVCLKKKREEKVKTILDGAVGGKSDSSDEEYCYNVTREMSKTPTTEVVLNDTARCKILIDTGSTVNIMDESTYQRLGRPKLSQRNLPRLLPYGDDKPLDLHGKCEVSIEKNEQLTVATFYVVASKSSGTLVGFETAKSLKLIQDIHKVEQTDVVGKFPKIFDGIGKLKTELSSYT